MNCSQRILVSFALLMAFLQTACAPQESAEESSEPPSLPSFVSPFSKPNDLFAARRILIKGHDDISDLEIEEELGKHGAKSIGEIPGINVKIVELPENANEKAIAALLAHNPKFAFAEVDAVEQESFIPNDTYYSSSWHLRNIGAPTAWDSSKGDGVIIAILDSGVEATHPDLAGKLVPGWNIWNNNSDTTDHRSHGTKVAGSAAAIANNSMGVAGVSMNSKIMPIRISSLDGYTTNSASASGLTWAADHGARVANLSFQTPCKSSTVQTAANYFRSKGGVVTGSAGNSGVNEGFTPSSLVTCVSATGSSNTITSWSAYGTYVDVAAPGSSIYTTFLNGAYGSVSGTSFAAPITAGVYALMMSANPDLTPSELDQILFSTALDVGATGFDSYYGHGRIDAAKAVAKAKSLYTPPDTLAPTAAIVSPLTASVVSGAVAVAVSASDNVAVTKTELYVNGALAGTDTTAPYSFSYNTAQIADGLASLVVKAYDAAGNVGTSNSVSLTVDNIPDADTKAPVVKIIKPAAGSSIASARWTVYISASATDNRAVKGMKLYINGTLRKSTTSNTLSFAWYVRYATKGYYNIKVTATDTSGNVGSSTIRVYK